MASKLEGCLKVTVSEWEDHIYKRDETTGEWHHEDGSPFHYDGKGLSFEKFIAMCELEGMIVKYEY